MSRQRIWAWAGVLVVSFHLLAALSLPGLQVGGSLRDRFLPEDPAVLGLLEEAQLFGSSEPLAVLVEPVAAGEWPALFGLLEVWCAQLASLPGVAGAAGPQDLPVPAWTDDRRWRTERIAETAAPARALATHPLAGSGFVRRDGKGAAILLSLDPDLASDFAARARTYRALQSWRDQQADPDWFRIVGVLALEQRTATLVVRDSARLTAALAVVIGLLLAIGLRSVTLALCCVAAALLNIASTFGLVAALGIHLSALSFAVAPIVLAIGLLDNVHLAYTFRRLRGHNESAGAAFTARDNLLLPCGWTTLTTVAALAALCASPVPQVRQFGLLGAIGTTIALVTSMALLPLVLGAPLLARLTFVRRTPATERSAPVASVERWTRIYRSRMPVYVALVLVVVFGPGLRRLELVTEYPRIFGDRHPVTTELERIEEQWGGVATVSLLLTPKPGHAIYDDAVIERLRDFHSLLATRELVTGVASPFSLVATGLQSYQERFGARPPEALRKALLDDVGRAEGDAANAAYWYDGETDTYRIMARVRMMQPALFPQLDDDLQGLAAGLDDFFTVRVSGWPLAYKHLETTLLHELATSMGWVALLIAILLLAALRDMRLWTAAIVANAVPVIVVFGALGTFGTGFGTALLLIPGLALGLIVDDTLHAGLSLRAAGSYDAAAGATALAGVRAPLAITSAILICLSLGLVCSEFSMNRAMGAVLGPIVALAWLADTVLLPALLNTLNTNSH